MTFATQHFQLVQRDTQFRIDEISGKNTHRRGPKPRTGGEGFPEKQPVYHDQEGSKDDLKTKTPK